MWARRSSKHISLWLGVVSWLKREHCYWRFWMMMMRQEAYIARVWNGVLLSIFLLGVVEIPNSFIDQPFQL